MSVLCRLSRAEKHHVPGSALLDLGHVEAEEAVQPADEFLTIETM